MVTVLLAALFVSGAGAGLMYSGPNPPKPDIPYLVHADTLLETESKVAVARHGHETTTYVIPGSCSPVKTPLAAPVLMLAAAELEPDRLQLFRLQPVRGSRELVFHSRARAGSMPLRISVAPVGGSLYRVEVLDSLPRGEYALSPDGSNDVFCFAVF